MSKTTEQEWMLTASRGQKILRVEIVNDGRGIKYYTIPELECKKGQPQPGSKEFEKMFPIVDIEGISLEDEFMQYEPQTDNEKRVKASIIEAKKNGMRNFRIPSMDPSFDDDEETIIYCTGRKPAVGKSPIWWYKNAPKFMPSKNSRLKDDRQADIVLGVMRIKQLVEKEGYKVAEAWDAVCNDSKKLGHYWNSKNAKHELERTGSRQIGNCFDLGNTFKIVKDSVFSDFMSVGGYYNQNSSTHPLAYMRRYSENEYINCEYIVGELVLDE